MPRFLLATGSVHTTAAACDYLAERLRVDDEVLVATAVAPGDDQRDGGDAGNVATVRLGAHASVETEVVEGEPSAVVLRLAAERDVDELVIGARSGAPGGGPAVGSTATAILAGADRPVVVVPAPEIE